MLHWSRCSICSTLLLPSVVMAPASRCALVLSCFFFNVFRARLPKSSCTGRDIVKVCQKLQQNDTKRTSTQFGCKASSNRKAFSGLLLRRFHELRGERQHLHPAHLLIVTSWHHIAWHLYPWIILIVCTSAAWFYIIHHHSASIW